MDKENGTVVVYEHTSQSTFKKFYGGAQGTGLLHVGENRFAVRWGGPLSWTILGHTCRAKVRADECAAIALGVATAGVDGTGRAADTPSCPEADVRTD